MPEIEFYKLSAGAALRELGSSADRGLTEAEARARLARDGPNELVERGKRSPWAILAEQLTSVLVIILILAAVVSGAMGLFEYFHTGRGLEEIYDAIAIGIIVVLNTLLGFSQEYRAEKAMAALKRLSVPRVRVRREGELREIPATQLVAGDVVLLEAGNLVPADCRLLEAVNLRVQESALTGESEPVEKDTAALVTERASLGDRRNMAFMGTVVTYGRGAGVVTATGMRTELGAVATMLQAAQRQPTPLQKKLARLGRSLAVAALVLVAVIFVQGLLRGGLGIDNIKLMFLTAVSMAVAAVPEGLPAVVTIALALGAQRMLRRRALIRKLLAVETLGSVTIICSDKTGTLTENRMTVTVLDVAGHRVDLLESLRRPDVEVEEPGANHTLLQGEAGMAVLLAAAALCNDAVLKFAPEEAGRAHAVGDPTEGALVVAAAELGLVKGELERALPRVAELPFDSERKRMMTIHRLAHCEQLPPALSVLCGEPLHLAPGEHFASVKGAVDGMLEISTQVWQEGVLAPLDAARRERIEQANAQLAGQGMRVLGVAVRPLGSNAPEHVTQAMERELIFVGLIAMIDPPRTEVKQAVATCKEAGIVPVMITGDHPLTARTIARELGIAGEGGQVVTGSELETMSLQELEARAADVRVYARVSPAHKLNIVQALQNRGQIVAMTGDGVNDAPALKKADIGVAMGITGTDVSKEAADMVLQDDNFSTIVAAVEEGRVIYDNIRKFIQYLLTTNSGELWVMFLSPILGMPLPLIPLQILWVNLVTDGLPALALAVEPAEAGTMRRPPRDPRHGLLPAGLWVNILWVGLLMAVLCLLGGEWGWRHHGFNESEEWHMRHYRTIVFTIITFTQMANVLAVRSGRVSLFRAGLFSNKAMLAAVLATVGLQMVLLYVPVFQAFFQTVPLGAGEVILIVVVSSIIFWAVELDKLLKRKFEIRSTKSEINPKSE